jgi:hypothetical protein
VAVVAVVAALALGGGGDGGDKGGPADADTLSAPASSSSSGQTAAIPEANLTANPSFERDLAGWDDFNTALQRVEAADAPDGDHVAQVTVTGSATEYAIDDSPDSVEASASGETYNAVAWVKATASTDGKPVCLSIRERPADGAGTGIASSEVSATAGEYRPVRVSYTAQGDGNRIDVHVFRQGDGVQPDEAFLVDAITLATGEAEAQPSPECSL